MHVPASRSVLQLTGNRRRGRYGRTINGNAEFVDLSEMLLTSSESEREPYIPLPPAPPFPSLRAIRTLEHSSFGTVISDNRQEMDQPARARRPRPPGLYRHFNPL